MTDRPDQKLIVLDVNGVLCHKHFTGKSEESEKERLKGIPLEQIGLRNFIVFLRPGARKFLDFCFKNFDVGFFSSTTYHNAWPILEQLLSPDQRKEVKFFWYRDQTRLDPDYLSDPKVKKFDTVKRIHDILESPVINENRRYSLKNVLLVDDSEKKTRFSDPKNICIVGTFDISPYLESGKSERSTDRPTEDVSLFELTGSIIKSKFDLLEEK